MSTAPAPELLLHEPQANSALPAPAVTVDASLDSLAQAIHVWTLPGLPVSANFASLAPLHALLSPEERARADAFHFPVHRAGYIANRGRLRLLLAHYLERAPEAVRFAYGPQGKPYVQAFESHGITFNLSHTDGLGLVALSLNRRLGIDVEEMKPAGDLLDLARQQFSPLEYDQLCGLSPAEQRLAFYRCWTRKEAVLKFLGDGLQRPLNQFQVSLLPGAPALLLACDWATELCQSLQLHSLEPGGRYAAALVYERMPHDTHLSIQSFHLSGWETCSQGPWI